MDPPSPTMSPMRRLTALLLSVAVFGLFGCGGPKPEPLGIDEGQRRLEAALQDIPHVESLHEVKYSMQGAFVNDSAWMTATLHTDSEDDAINHEVLRTAARRIVEAMHDNFPKRSALRLTAVTPEGRWVRLSDAGMRSAVPTLDEAAEHLGIPRER